MHNQVIAERATIFATQMREKLGLGIGPIRDIFDLLDKEGIIVVKMYIESECISGAFSYNPENKTAKILVNTRNSSSRQNFTAAHEYCHFLKDKDKHPALIDYENNNNKSDYEQFADYFAIAFLMPAQSVEQFIRRYYKKQPNQVINNDLVIHCKYFFGTSYRATIYRLSNLGYKFEKDKNLIIDSISELNQRAIELGYEPDMPKFDSQNIKEIDLSRKYRAVAYKNYFNGKISIGKLAEFLHLPYEIVRDQVARIKTKIRREGGIKE